MCGGEGVVRAQVGKMFVIELLYSYTVHIIEYKYVH